MATRITRTVIDDLDGDDAAGTYRFALEDTTFEIDLSEANLARLRAALAPFMSAGRRLPNNRSMRGATRPTATSPVKRMRRWWADNQHRDDIPDYRRSGRLPQQVVDAYQQATTPQQP